MKNCRIFHISLAILSIITLTRCATNQPKSAPSGPIEIMAILEDQKVAFAEDTSQLIMKSSLKNLTIWASAFPISQNDPNIFRLMKERRKQLFLQQFDDEVDPYTGYVNKRSQCLIGNKNDAVLFYSGDGQSWPDCQRLPLVNQQLSIRSIPSKRTWIQCNNKIWEFTIQNIETQGLKFECAKNQ